MIELTTNQKVPLEIGGTCTVKKELGRGGQGIVYLVDLNGKDMALKWYTSIPEESFYKNLKANVSSQAPSDAFIWPQYLTKVHDGQFGYIMKLRPQGYYEFGDFLLAKQKFTSFYAMLNAAMKICDGFKNLHRLGFSYQD
ncbi:MAG: serine/threonine protein kinase, partial [Bacteroidales bacterium]|nr:serine/threonine protein kinase [Bacteroidales bacterium]